MSGSLALLLQIVAGLVVLFYLVAIWGGILLLKGDRRAIKINLTIWALQIPVIATAHFSFLLSIGGLLSVWLKWFGAGFNVQLGSTFAFNVSAAPDPDPERFIGINVVAVVVFMILRRYRSVRPVSVARVLERERA